MKALALIAFALLLVGCSERYRYECQDPANAEKQECTRPACEADGMCYDTLNGLQPKQEEASAVEETEETAATPVADCNCENKGE